MVVGYAIVAIVAIVVAVFALQNSDPTSVRFAVWSMENVPVAAVVLATLAAGMFVVGVPLMIQRWRLRARVRSLEARLAALESAQANRQAQIRAAPPPPRSAAGE